MEIIFNKKLVETKEIDGEPCILIKQLIELADIHFTQVYKKLRNTYSLKKYTRGGGRNRYITLEGCVKVLESFREPNDALINVLKDCTKQEEPSKAPTPEKLIDLEMKRLDNEKLDFSDLEKRVSLLEVKSNNIVADSCISKAHFQKRIEDSENKLEDLEANLRDIDNHLSYLNDKPNQSSFKDLLKECIKEIIKEELTNERA